MDTAIQTGLSAQLLQKLQITADARVAEIAGPVHQKLRDNRFTITNLAPALPKDLLPPVYPGISDGSGLFLPADASVLAKYIPGYTEPSDQEVQCFQDYAGAKENYGTAPAAAAALISKLAPLLTPTAFVFGTARGRLEQIIAHNSICEVVTLDIPTELLYKARGTPNINNLGYRTKIGVDSDEKIGDLFRNDPNIAGRVHQILGDSFTFNPGALKSTMRLIVVDACHQLPNALMDFANALDLAHANGAVIVADDCRKMQSPLNTSVEAALGIFSQVTGLPIICPGPKPKCEGFKAEVGVVIVPANFNKDLIVVDGLNCIAYMKKLARDLMSIQESKLARES